jgi:hypothetical protein
MDNDNLLPLLTTSVASSCKLPEYWPEAPALWFSRAECSFLLRNVTEQREKFCLVEQSLPREAMRLVVSPPQQLMYNALKDRLLASHQLTDIQKVELLVDMPALGDWKPTQLLAAMVEACPRGQEDSVFMSALFLRKLPADVRILLAHMDHTRLNELAGGYAGRPGGGGRSGGGSWGGGGGGCSRWECWCGEETGAAKQKKKKPLEEPELTKAARQAARLCLRHWQYGATAFSCNGDCCWPGNGLAGGN